MKFNKTGKTIFRFSIGTLVILLMLKPKEVTANTDEVITPTEGDNPDNSQNNLAAFLKTIQYAEGTFKRSNPYAVTYGYEHTIKDFSDHPAITGEWTGKTLPDRYCIAVGLKAGCKSTAAGAYQFILPTWKNLQQSMSFLTFEPYDQDYAATNLIERKGALSDIEIGNFQTAIRKCNTIWASLPDSPYGQPTRSMSQLEKFYVEQGGTFLNA